MHALEPAEEALVIATAHEEGLEGRLFWWSCGKPRRFWSDGIFIGDPAVVGDRLYCAASEKRSFNPQHYVDVFDDRHYRVKKEFFALAGGPTLHALGHTYEFIPDEDGGRNPHDVRIGMLLERRKHLHRCRGQDVCWGGDAPYLLDWDKAVPADTDSGARAPQEVWRLGRTPQRVWTKQGNENYGCLAVLDGHGYIGGTGRIVEFGKGPVRTHIVNEASAMAELHSYRDDPGPLLREGLRRGLSREDYGESEIREMVMDEGKISSIAMYQGSVLYACGSRLYMMGRPDPVHAFRHPITGIAAVPLEMRKELGERTDMRMGSCRRNKLRLVKVA